MSIFKRNKEGELERIETWEEWEQSKEKDKKSLTSRGYIPSQVEVKGQVLRNPSRNNGDVCHRPDFYTDEHGQIINLIQCQRMIGGFWQLYTPKKRLGGILGDL